VKIGELLRLLRVRGDWQKVPFSGLCMGRNFLPGNKEDCGGVKSMEFFQWDKSCVVNGIFKAEQRIHGNSTNTFLMGFLKK